jgi:dCTP deaminase
MPIMSDKWIRQKAENEQLIVPFHAESRSNNEDGTPVTSYGLSSFGYDIRLGNVFRFFNPANIVNRNLEIKCVRDAIEPDVIDPVNFNENLTSRHELREDECIIMPPGSIASRTHLISRFLLTMLAGLKNLNTFPKRISYPKLERP